MKKLLLFLTFIQLSIVNAQCSVSTLTLNLMGKKYSEVTDVLYSNVKVSNINKLFHFPGRTKYSLPTDFEYLKEPHTQTYIDFEYSDNGCFNNQKTEYFLTLIDDKVYKVTVDQEYELTDVNTRDKDYQRLYNLIIKNYPISTGTYDLSHRFNITTENPEGDHIKTGTSEEFSKVKLSKNVHIWKINRAAITKETNFSIDQTGHLSLPKRSLQIEIKFIDLNNTVLDNRGF